MVDEFELLFLFDIRLLIKCTCNFNEIISYRYLFIFSCWLMIIYYDYDDTLKYYGKMFR